MPGRPRLEVTPFRARVHLLIRKWSRACAGLLITLVLTGCAAQFAYRDGKELVAQDKVEEGLAKFREAMTLDPHSLEYKEAYLQTRERTAYRSLEQADRFAAAGQRSEAAKLYRRALGIDPSSERARAGLNKLERDQRHGVWLKEGQAALDKNDIASAKLKLAAILTEDPNDEASRALQRAITEKTTQLPFESALSRAYQKPITIEFKDVALKQVFEVISRSSGLNFLFDKEMKLEQKMSIYLKNSTIEAAVNFILLTNQLAQQVLDANTILIYSNTAAKQKDYQEMVVRSFFLANAEAKTVANTLKTIVKSRDIVVDEKLNMLIVRDSPDAIKLAEKLIALQDVPEPEVMLEVEILEVKRTRLLDLGIQWPNSLSLTPLPLGSLSNASTGTTGATASAALTLRDLLHQNSASLAAGISPVVVNVRKEDSDANLLANPRIRARNHEKAKILIGNRVPNITTTATSTGFVSEAINYVDVGLTLNVEPTIYLDNDVAIKVALEVSTIVDQLKTSSGSVAYQIGTRTASTVLRLKDGENQVLAGLINDEDRRSGFKVPGLGDLPLIGRLFGSTTDDNQKTEIVLSITPHIIRNIQRPDAAQAQFTSGTESSLRNRPDVVAAVPAMAIPAVTPTPGVGRPGLSPSPSPATPAVPTPPGISGPAVVGPAMSTGNAAAPATGDASLANVAAAGSRTGTLQWQGPANVKVGDSFALQLMMQSDQPITSLPLAINFDQSTLQVTSVTEGVFLRQGGAQTNFTNRVDNGQILMTSTRVGDGGATRLAAVATINFRALAPADAASVQLLTIAPVGLAGSSVNAAPPAPFTVQIQP